MSYRLIPRAEWGARHDNGTGGRKLPASEAWLHHSVTTAPDLVPPFDDDYAAIRALEDIGESRFGAGISYTRCITPAGLVFEGHSIDRIGTHTANHNTAAVGYCLVGNYDVTAPPDAMIHALVWCLQEDYRRGWLGRQTLNGGHRDLKSTACPGQHAYALIPTINQLALGPPITLEDGMTAQNEAYIIDMLERLGNRVYSMLQLAEKVGDGPTKGEALPYVTSYLALAHRTEAYLRDMSPTTVGGPTAGEELKAVAALGTASQAAAPEIDYDQLAEKITAGILPHLQPGATPDQVKTIVRDALGDTHLTVQTGGIESR